MNKTLRAFVLSFALFFTLSTVTAPARAVLPLIASGVAFISEGSVAANGIAALTVGTVAGMIYLGNQQSGAGNEVGSVMEIPLGTSRNRPLSTPSNYSPPANNNSQPIPPSVNGSPVNTCTIYGFVSSPDCVAARQQAIDYWKSLYPASAACAVFTGGTTASPSVAISGCAGGTLGGTFASVCPAGYAASGSSCVLSNAAAVQKPADGRCQILVSVAGYVVDPNDPECGGAAANLGVTVTPSKISVTKPGSLTNGEVTINGDGSRTVTYKTSNVTNNTTTITTVNLIPTSDGQNAIVSGNSTTVVAGTGTAAGSTPAAPAAPTINIPTDYNREATQQQIKSSVDTLHGDMDSSAFSQPADPAVPADLASAENKKITDELVASETSFNNFKLLNWSTWIPVFPASSCSPFTGTVLNKSISWDFCPKIALLNELIGWLLAVFAAWSISSLMFRRD